jgi:O-antigen ligase
MFLLPYGGKPVVWCILAIVAEWIFNQRWKKLQGFLSIKNPLIWLQLFYFLHVAALLWTNNFHAGGFDVQQKLSLLIFPILFYSNRFEIVAHQNLLFKSFIVGNAIAAIYCISIGIANKYFLHKVYLQNEGILPSYAEFSLFLHVAYFSLYLNIASFFSLVLLQQSNKKAVKLFYLLIILLFAFSIYFSSSKAAIIAYLATIALFFAKQIWQSKHRLMGVGLFIFLSVALFFVVKNNPRFESFKSMTSEIFHPQNVDPNAPSENSNGQRIFATKTAIHLIQINWLLGVGTGDVIDELEVEYTKNNLTVLAHKHLNCHNQYIESTLQLGILGCMFILLVSIGTIVIGLMKKNMLLILFGVAFSINILFESMLNTQAGLVFFAAFYCFLFLIIPNKKLVD